MSKVETIKIGPDGKYALIVESSDYTGEELELVSKKLNEWWQGDYKFIVIGSAGIDMRFERVGE